LDNENSDELRDSAEEDRSEAENSDKLRDPAQKYSIEEESFSQGHANWWDTD